MSQCAPANLIVANHDDVASLESRNHHTSWPTGPAAFRASMSAGSGAFKSHCATISAKLYLCLGVRTIRPSSVVSSLRWWPTP